MATAKIPRYKWVLFRRWRGAWWIGVEKSFTMDGWVLNFFGFAMLLPNESLWRLKKRLRELRRH